MESLQDPPQDRECWRAARPWWGGGQRQTLAHPALPCSFGERLLHNDRSAQQPCIADSQPSPMVSFVLMAWGLQEELRAYLFLFVEVACVGHGAAACRQLRACLWMDTVFWRAYGGPCLSIELATLPAESLRETFRKWLFHLDGAWTEEFRNFVEKARESEFGADYTQLLADAGYIASGLMLCDGSSAISEFTEIACTLLTEYDPCQLDERSIAQKLVARVERRCDVFTCAQVAEVISAYDQSAERAILEQCIEDGGSEADPFLLPWEDASEEEGFPGAESWDQWEPPGVPPPADDADNMRDLNGPSPLTGSAMQEITGLGMDWSDWPVDVVDAGVTSGINSFWGIDDSAIGASPPPSTTV